jgi:hypothetical protein
MITFCYDTYRPLLNKSRFYQLSQIRRAHIMKIAILIGVLGLGFVSLLFSHAFAQDGVVVIPLLGDAPVATYQAPVQKTGQTTSYRTGDDGDEEVGVSWPNPRFTDNADGTVTDNLTGLIWLKQANYNSTAGGTGTAIWNNAIDFCKALETGMCGLSDGSAAGDWRLPTVKELQSLVHYGYYDPSLLNTAGTGKWTSGDPFTNVQSSYYWSSTTYEYATNNAWYVYMTDGLVTYRWKANENYVWPVRGGQ